MPTFVKFLRVPEDKVVLPEDRFIFVNPELVQQVAPAGNNLAWIHFGGNSTRVYGDAADVVYALAMKVDRGPLPPQVDEAALVLALNARGRKRQVDVDLRMSTRLQVDLEPGDVLRSDPEERRRQLAESLLLGLIDRPAESALKALVEMIDTFQVIQVIGIECVDDERS